MAEGRTNEPGVILDVVFEEGLLFFELSNRASIPVTDVAVKFDRPVMAPDGVTDLTKLRLFRKMPFLAPDKAIRVFADSAAGYFARKQPNIIRVVLTWKQGGKALTTTITHDLRVYGGLPYVVGRGEEARRGVALTDQTQTRGR